MSSQNGQGSGLAAPDGNPTPPAPQPASCEEGAPEREGVSDLDKPDYRTDEFRMYCFKVVKCTKSHPHDWTECPFVHPGEKARRRDPCRFKYNGTACPDFRKGSCKRGDACTFAHGVFECWLHTSRYRTKMCRDGPSCARRVCFFAHAPAELRSPPPPEASSSSERTDETDKENLEPPRPTGPAGPQAGGPTGPDPRAESGPRGPPESPGVDALSAMPGMVLVRPSPGPPGPDPVRGLEYYRPDGGARAPAGMIPDPGSGYGDGRPSDTVNHRWEAPPPGPGDRLSGRAHILFGSYVRFVKDGPFSWFVVGEEAEGSWREGGGTPGGMGGEAGCNLGGLMSEWSLRWAVNGELSLRGNFRGVNGNAGASPYGESYAPSYGESYASPHVDPYVLPYANGDGAGLVGRSHDMAARRDDSRGTGG